MEFDEDFLQIQGYIGRINSALVIISSDQFDSEIELFEKMLLQIKIYGSKIIELYQSLDEICPTDRQLDKVIITNQKQTNNNNSNYIKELNYEEVWQALNKGFNNDDIQKATDLLQQLDYTLSPSQNQIGQYIQFLQLSNREKDKEMEKLCQIFENEYPQTYFKQADHLANMLLQYSQMIPVLVQENEQLQIYVEQNKQLSKQLIGMEEKLQNLQEFKCHEQNSELINLKQHLQNIEKQLKEQENKQDYQIKLQKQEELINNQRKQIQQYTIEQSDLQFKLNTTKEELNNCSNQISTLTESFDRMQNEYKKQIQKKNQLIQEYENKTNLDQTQRNFNSTDIDQIQIKIQQFKQLYEQKLKILQSNLTNTEQENRKLKEVVKQSALEVDNLRLQIEQVIHQNNKQQTNKITKNPIIIKKKENYSSINQSKEYLTLLSKYQEMVEKNEQLSQQLYSQILDGSVLSTVNT